MDYLTNLCTARAEMCYTSTTGTTSIWVWTNMNWSGSSHFAAMSLRRGVDISFVINMSKPKPIRFDPVVDCGYFMIFWVVLTFFLPFLLNVSLHFVEGWAPCSFVGSFGALQLRGSCLTFGRFCLDDWSIDPIDPWCMSQCYNATMLHGHDVECWMSPREKRALSWEPFEKEHLREEQSRQTRNMCWSRWRSQT